MNSIESRLAKVEGQLRFHRTIIAGLLIALAALVGYGATEGIPDEIRARKIVVIDSKGKDRLKLEVEKGGFTREKKGRGILNFLSHDGETIATIGENYAGNGYARFNSYKFRTKYDGSGALWLGVGSDHNASLTLRPNDWRGIKGKIEIDTSPGENFFSVMGPMPESDSILVGLVGDQPALFSLWSDMDLNIILQIKNKENKSIIYAGSEKSSGGGVLSVHGKDGKELLYAGANRSGDGSLRLASKDGKQLVSIGSVPGGG